MKKFLIGVIFLIPIVVVLALSATGAIISMTTPVNPSNIVIKNSDNEEIERGAIIKVDSRNFDEFIIIDVLPAITQDKGITYERDDEAGSGEIELEQIGDSNRYSIIPKKVGVTKIVIRAKANANVFKEITFYVSSDSVEEVMIFGANGRDVGEYLEIIKETRLFVDIYPFEAVRNNDITWTSSNPNVIKVSQNGVLEVVGRGLSRIKVTIIDKDGNTISDFVDVDTSNAVIKSDVIYVEEEVSIEYVKDNYVFDEDATVEKVDDTFVVTSNLGVYTINVISVTAGDWDIVELPEVVYMRNGGVSLVAKDLLSGEIIQGEVTFSNPELMTYEKETELLLPTKVGLVTVNFTANGVTKSKEILIKDNPLAFELEMSSADQRLGIQMDRTFGKYWLTENNQLTTEYRFGLADKSNTFDVKWTVNDPSYADIIPTGEGQDIIINFKDEAEGQNVTITATLQVNGFINERVKRSFTFKIREQGNSINVYSFDQAKWVRDFRFYNMVMQSDIVATELLEDVSGSVYGNGFKWDGTQILNMTLEDGSIEYDYEDFVYMSRKAEYKANYDYFVAEGNTSINFEDIIMFNANTLDESTNRGAGVKSESLWHETRSIFDDFPKDLPVRFKHLQVYNTHRGITIGYHYDVRVEGCILGDNAETCVTAYYYNEKERRYLEDGNKLTFHNNVFKISKGPSVMMIGVPIGMDIDSRSNIAPDLTFTGFNDFYNWKTKEEFYDSIASLISGYVGMFATGDLKEAIDTLLLPILDKVLVDISKGDSVQDLYYKYAGEEYVSFGAIGIAALFYYDKNKVTVESDNLMLTDLPFRDSNGNPVGRMAGLESLIKTLAPELGMTNCDTLCNPSTIVCTDFSSQEPNIKPGDPIPNSLDLYDKLTGRE